MDRVTPLQRSKIMSTIKSTGTKDEIRLAKALWHLGYRYGKNNRTVYGTPDLTFKKYKIAIFVDSEFFHGKNWETKQHQIKSNIEYWHKKIEKNIQRDIEVNKYQKSHGWEVIRFWSDEIKIDLNSCITIIQNQILQRQNST